MMIGHIQGNVLFSDGTELIVLTASGIGYQIFYNRIVPEGKPLSIYISHIIKENGQTLFGFESLKSKKLFELLLSVNGVGPKSAYALLGFLGAKDLCEAILFENKKILQSAPGIGPKAASQIILDLAKKIQKIHMISSNYKIVLPDEVSPAPHQVNQSERLPRANFGIVEEALMACKELGFKEEQVRPMIQSILEENETLTKPEQLVHLVLKQV